jgi:hypothetical protein
VTPHTPRYITRVVLTDAGRRGSLGEMKATKKELEALSKIQG